MQTRLKFWEEDIGKLSKQTETMFNQELLKIEGFLDNYKKINGDPFGTQRSEMDLQEQVENEKN